MAIDEHGPQSLGRVAHQTGLTKPTAHRLLASLTHRHMVIQDRATGEYLLGPGAFGIADAVMRGVAGLGVLLDPILRRLSAATGETVALYVRAGLKRMCVGQVASSQPISYAAQVGGTRPLHAGSMGKLLLAMSDRSERDDLLQELPLAAETAATITDRAALTDELDRIARQGWATSRGERLLGAASISAPIYGGDGRILAALSIIGPDRRLSDAAMARFRPLLVQAAAEITEQLSTRRVPGVSVGTARRDG
jgi:IclR family acetate operon transcriptional repressor